MPIPKPLTIEQIEQQLEAAKISSGASYSLTTTVSVIEDLGNGDVICSLTDFWGNENVVILKKSDLEATL